MATQKSIFDLVVVPTFEERDGMFVLGVVFFLQINFQISTFYLAILEESVKNRLKIIVVMS